MDIEAQHVSAMLYLHLFSYASIHCQSKFPTWSKECGECTHRFDVKMVDFDHLDRKVLAGLLLQSKDED
jgi:hypothetical protein